MNFFKKTLIATSVACTLGACAMTDYSFGDASRAYCAATTEEDRDFARSALSLLGITVGVDYCAAVGLVDFLMGKGD